ncbi:MAG TPA: hypothetical protein VG324_05440, partial [Blastocatellia bacterium]|nr:hypothetical protein [Blastocatellia bacterium]
GLCARAEIAKLSVKNASKAPFDVSLLCEFISPFPPKGQHTQGFICYRDNKRARDAQEDLPQLIAAGGIKNIGGLFTLSHLSDT